MIVPLAALLHAGNRGAGEHRGGEDLDVHEFRGLVGWQIGQRHVVGDPGVVHQQSQRLGGADLGHPVDALAGGKVRCHGSDLHFRVRVGELRQSLLASAHDHQVVAVGGEAIGVCPADSRGGSGDERKLAHDVPFQVSAVGVAIEAHFFFGPDPGPSRMGGAVSETRRPVGREHLTN